MESKERRVLQGEGASSPGRDPSSGLLDSACWLGQHHQGQWKVSQESSPCSHTDFPTWLRDRRENHLSHYIL